MLSSTWLLAGSLVVGAPVGAAGSPEGAVQELVERIGSGGFDDLTGVACPESATRIRSEFDPSAADASFGDVAVEIVDPAITLVSEEDGAAVVNLAATLRVSLDADELREFLRVQLEAGGEEPDAEAVEAMLAALSQTEVPVDEDLSVIERGGEWLICDAGGGFTEAGICGLVTVEEIAAISPVPIGSNVGSGASGEYCQWIGSTDTDYLSIDVGLIGGSSLDDFRGDADARDLTVGDRAAVATSDQLFVEVDGGVLSILPDVGDAPSAGSVDPIALATSVAELFLPRLDRLPALPDGSGTSGDAAGLLADCGAIAVDDLTRVGSLPLDDVAGSDGYCIYSSTGADAGSHFVTISLDPSSTVDDVSDVFAPGSRLEVMGRPAYEALETLWVQLDGAVLSIAPVLSDSPAAEGIDPYDYARAIAEHVIGVLEPES